MISRVVEKNAAEMETMTTSYKKTHTD